MKNSISRLVPVIFILVLLGTPVLAQTTGKVAGIVTDANTNEPMVGANIVLEGTTFGAAVDLDGNFYIINVPPGMYTLSVQMIGYETTKVQNLRVSVNRTTSVEVSLKPDILETDVIVVEADKVAQKKDQTGSMSSVSGEQMALLPVESVGAVVGMQAGVVGGHFRGGRMDEVSYLIDGLPVNDAFGGVGQSVTLETEAVQDLEVITGTFNAEYGRAMSGIVNAVTRGGGTEYHASFSAAYGNYFTANKDIFIGLKNTELDRNQDYKLMLSGPLFIDKLSFFFNTRYQNNKNHLNGVYRFEMDDYSDFSSYPDGLWISQYTGDSSYVPMNGSENLSFMGKLSYELFNTIQLDFLYTRNNDLWDGYSHIYKYAPKGHSASYRETNMYMLQMNHTLAKNAFYEAKLSYLDNYDGYYLYKDPLDQRYLSDIYLGNATETGFYTGGQDKGHSENWQWDVNFKLDATWQVSRKHSIKGGLLYTYHELKNMYSEIRNLPEYDAAEVNWSWWGSIDENGNIIPPPYQPVVYSDTTVYSDFYHVKPVEYSAYVQDKMEYEDMVVNFGFRMDYFDPKTVYPSQRRNPANQSDFPDNPEKMSTYPKADVKYQFSPRLGLAYQLGSRAILHFSYGHFFQMPPMYAMYSNNNFLVHRPDYSVTMGNAQLKAQKNVQYEVGLWQELMKDMGLEVTLYYVDIYNLLSAVVVTTYNETEYGLYSNKDYGNTKGITIKYDYRLGNLSAFLNYTLQYTRGNADNPTQTFSREGASQDPVNKLIVMSWDQRHTFNLTVGYNKINWGVTTTAYYNSGTPYTWQPLPENPLSRVNLYPNNDYSPTRMTMDLSAYYGINIYKQTQLRFTLDIYNLLDRLNEYGLNAQTGRAYTAIIRESDLALHHSNFNEYEDRVQDPSSYSAPRLIKFGIGVSY